MPNPKMQMSLNCPYCMTADKQVRTIDCASAGNCIRYRSCFKDTKQMDRYITNYCNGNNSSCVVISLLENSVESLVS